jgi:hypothetical protein
LREHYPLTRDFNFHLLDNDAKIPRRERAWRNKLKKEQGLSHEEATRLSKVDRSSNAVTFHPVKEMVLMPETVSRVTSGNMNERLAAFKTVSHEWWHAMRTDMKISALNLLKKVAQTYSQS